MKRDQQNITYTVVNPNTDKGARTILKQAIIEKLLLIQKGTLHSDE